MNVQKLARQVAEIDANTEMNDPHGVYTVAAARLSGLIISPGYWAYYAITATVDLDQEGTRWELRDVYQSLSAEQRLAVELVFLALCGICLRTFLAAERLADAARLEDLDQSGPNYYMTFTPRRRSTDISDGGPGGPGVSG